MNYFKTQQNLRQKVIDRLGKSLDAFRRTPQPMSQMGRLDAEAEVCQRHIGGVTGLFEQPRSSL